MATLEGWHPVLQALLATLFTWGMTALGALGVFLRREPSRKFLDTMLGFAAGVMIAASFFSLLLPAIELTGSWLEATVGFLAGGGFLRLVDMILPHLHLGFPAHEAEGLKTSWHRAVLLVLAVTLHNVPEGLAVGVAFGALAPGMGSSSLGGALALALGIGIQNLPEGLAVSVPLRREGLSAKRSFLFGQLSGAVEPVAGVLGAALVMYALPLLPYALGFAAGAMIFVVVEEVVPESQRAGHGDLATAGAMVGFALMMALDVALS